MRWTTEFMAAIGGVRAGPAARRTAESPSAARRGGARPDRRRVARPAAAVWPRPAADAPVGAASPPADHPRAAPHLAARSAADPPRGRGATPRSAAATRPRVVRTPHRRLARNLPWSRRGACSRYGQRPCAETRDDAVQLAAVPSHSAGKRPGSPSHDARPIMRARLERNLVLTLHILGPHSIGGQAIFARTPPNLYRTVSPGELVRAARN